MLSQSALARRLEERVAQDARLSAIEAAKKDAVARRVDVDTFQALVSAAHLRPMQGGLCLAPAAAGGKPAAPRNFRADGTLAGNASPNVPSTTLAAQPASHASQAPMSSDAALRSGALFVRAWRAAAPDGRVHMLRRAVAAGALPRLLRLELSSRLLGELVECLMDAAACPAAAGLGAAQEGKQPDEGAAAAAASSTAAQAAGAAPEHSDHQLVRTVLQAAEAASSYAVAQAGLSLQARQRLAGLKAAPQ